MGAEVSFELVAGEELRPGDRLLTDHGETLTIRAIGMCSDVADTWYLKFKGVGPMYVRGYSRKKHIKYLRKVVG